jgi:hypothetical protein
MSQSPDSRELSSFEDYLRQEVPKLFREALETAVGEETQLVEEKLKAQMVGLMQKAQDSAFSKYRAAQATTILDKRKGKEPETDEGSFGDSGYKSSEILHTFYQPPPAPAPPSDQSFLLDKPGQGCLLHYESAKENLPSDSGYGSNLSPSLGVRYASTARVDSNTKLARGFQIETASGKNFSCEVDLNSAPHLHHPEIFCDTGLHFNGESSASMVIGDDIWGLSPGYSDLNIIEWSAEWDIPQMQAPEDHAPAA